LFVVRTHFTLRDGTSHVGYSSPVPATDEAPDDLLGYLAPAIVTERGQVPFWFVVDSPPEPDFIRALYDRLARSRDQVWPVTFSADVKTRDDEVDTGTINEFQFLVSDGREFRLLRLR
jgi:hypothetical protein